ncbi:hypothetical protein BGZ83_006379 [Gryganskiella cystojenkinii]|nr:hypothetical protein BGZ83_006379 [Gryganskiella cystojenkinii]
MINGQSLINEGLDAICKNNGFQTWYVNQGIILGALVERSKGCLLGGDVLNTARTLASTAIRTLSNQNGILVETNKCETQASASGVDTKQFKGVFIRNLVYLNQVIGDGDIRAFILKNATRYGVIITTATTEWALPGLVLSSLLMVPLTGVL